jgi:hypothetical protein
MQLHTMCAWMNLFYVEKKIKVYHVIFEVNKGEPWRNGKVVVT